MPDALAAQTPEGELAAGLSQARSARDRGYLSQALEIVSELVTRFPDNPAPYQWKISVLVNEGRFAEAVEILELAAERVPSHTAIAIEHAWLAYHQHHYDEAIERWRAILDLTPEARIAHRGLAMSLRNAGRPDEAEVVLLAAMEAFKDDPWMAADYAALASHRRDFSAALARYTAARDAFPGHVLTHSGVGIALMDAERFEEAEATFRETLALFPDEIDPRIHAAILAERRHDWAEAARRWGDVRARAPGRIDGYARGIAALTEAAQTAEAAALASQALEQWPNDADIAARHAQLHGAKREADQADRARDIVMQFASLGGSGHGCEFGLFQRSFGAEPLGLLRWSDLGYELLAGALEARFGGVGDPENTEIFIPGEDEYWTKDKRYWMVMRTFVKTDEMPIEKMEFHACRRLRYLRDELIDDLENNAKIFVFKNMFRNLTDAEIARLHAAVRSYGDSTLLYVRYEDDAHPNGTVVVDRPGLLIGYIDHFAFSPEDKQLNFPTESWFAICERAHALWSASAAEAGSRPTARVAPAPDDTKQRFLRDAAGPAIARASTAEQERNWPLATELWDYVRGHFPSMAAGYTGAARARREQRRFDEAEAIMAEAAARMPDDPSVASERCWLPQIARDFTEADRRWTDLRAHFPNISAGWIAGAAALRELRDFDEAESLLRDALLRFPDESAPVAEHAWLATIRRDWPEAVRRWEAVRTRFPDRADGYLRGALALGEVWRYAEAEALLAEGMARFPDDSGFAVEYAATASRQAHIDDAIARYAIIRERFPNLTEGYLGGARALRNQFKLSDAEAMFERAQALLPDEPQFALEHALIPVFAPLRQDRDHGETIRRLEAVAARFPDFAPAYIELIRQLRESERFAEADVIARAGMTRIPGSGTLLVEYANIARERGDLSEAIKRYSLARDRFPGEVGGSIGLGTALVASGRESDAETVLQDAMARHPDTSASFIAYAEIAMKRGDWKEAVKRLTDAYRLFPDDKAFAQRISDAKLMMIGEENGGEVAKQDEGGSDDPRAQFRELIMQFESLGGRGLGCEFGMFQREFAAEPLGLLRWADMPYDGIVSMLESGFKGVGEPEHTSIFVNRENGRPEYCSVDKRGFMFMRAFVYEDEMPMERMEKQVLQRLKFLKNGLMDDLESGDKIFVWRLTERNLTDAELDRLQAAVNSYGKNVLLYVRLEDKNHPNGTVEVVRPGLMVGYMDRFKMAPDGSIAATPPSGSWAAICKKAHALWPQAMT
jgi:tetratricopeptide (TPR) repeat protein